MFQCRNHCMDVAGLGFSRKTPDNRELNGGDLLTKHRALMSLCDIFHDPKNMCQALQVGIVSSLKRLLADIDATVRHKTTEVLYIISGHASGRDAFLEHKIITPLSNLIHCITV